MKELIWSIIGIIVSLYIYGFIVAGFTEFAMDKKILDINKTYTKVSIIMPHGTHHNLKLETNRAYVLEGNITIKHNNKIIYSGILEEPSIESNLSKAYSSLKAYYSLVSKDVRHHLFKKNKRYEVEIRLQNVLKPIVLKLVWLERKYGSE